MVSPSITTCFRVSQAADVILFWQTIPTVRLDPLDLQLIGGSLKQLQTL